MQDRVGRPRTSPDQLGGVDIKDSLRVSVEQIDSMQTSAKDLLVADLKRLRQEAGQPSLGELAQGSQRKFSKSTLDDHLSGRRTTIPNWRITAAYVQACHDFAESTGLNIRRLGTMEEWRARWQAAQRGDRVAASPIREAQGVATYTMMDDDPGYVYEIPDSDPYEIADPDPTVLSPGAYGETTASIRTVRRRLKVDLAGLRNSLPSGSGLLIVISGPTTGTRFAVADDLVTIGRDPESDIRLDDPTISRRHAVIHRYGSEFTVRDVGSRNGTFLHQKEVVEESPLPSNEELQVGVFRMLFVHGISA